jgi:DNA-binding MarR family transcriptional regulator
MLYPAAVTPSPRPARIGILLTQLGSHAATRFAARTKELGVTPAQAGVIRILGREQGISQRDLADRLGAVQSRVVALIDGLEQLGLVARARSTTDRRNYELRLTDAGRAILARLRTVAEAHEAELTSALSDEQRDQLAALLERIRSTTDLRQDVHPGYRETQER